MNYTVQKLAELSGVSARTLRYYDGIGLLRPARAAENGYRLYGPEEVDRLQQILFYRELGVPLETIGQLLSAPDFDRQTALEQHLSALLQQKQRIERLIDTVSQTIRAEKGESDMNDAAKFEGFKKQKVAENEAAYGKELRARYGDETIDASRKKVMDMSEGDWQNAQGLSERINALLKEAMEDGDPACSAAQQACDLHRQWLCLYWPEGAYSKEAHCALADGYVADPRFTAYYDKIAPGCTAFFRDAIHHYCNA